MSFQRFCLFLFFIDLLIVICKSNNGWGFFLKQKPIIKNKMLIMWFQLPAGLILGLESFSLSDALVGFWVCVKAHIRFWLLCTAVLLLLLLLETKGKRMPFEFHLRPILCYQLWLFYCLLEVQEKVFNINFFVSSWLCNNWTKQTRIGDMCGLFSRLVD